jgi:hypothetical protein
MIMKKCAKCGQVLELNDYNFRRRKDSKDGFRNTCRVCDGNKYQLPRPVAKKGYFICYGCGRELPLDSNHFVMTNQKRTGFNTKCRECVGIEFKSYKPIPKEGFKFCSICGVEYPDTQKYFNIHRKNPEIQLRARCKHCESQYHKDHRKINKERYSKQSKEYYENNKSEVLKKCAVRYSNIKDEINLYRRDFYQNHKEEYNERHKRYDKSDAGKIAGLRKYAKRKSALSRAIVDFTSNQWRECNKYFEKSCAYCSETRKVLHMDHVIPVINGGDHTRRNIVLACKSCNCSKQDKVMEEWYRQQIFFSEERLQKIYDWINLKGIY